MILFNLDARLLNKTFSNHLKCEYCTDQMFVADLKAPNLEHFFVESTYAMAKITNRKRKEMHRVSEGAVPSREQPVLREEQ